MTQTFKQRLCCNVRAANAPVAQSLQATSALQHRLVTWGKISPKTPTKTLRKEK